MKLKPGTEIDVLVGGVSYKTVIDEHGVQRFKANAVIKHLLDSKKLDLNDLARDYHAKKFDQRSFAEFHMSLGYSVSGFCDLSFFEDLDILNPVWG